MTRSRTRCSRRTRSRPGAAKYARVALDDDTGDFRVYELIVPEELEDQLLVEAEEEARTVDPETGEMIEAADPEIDPVKFAEYRDQIDERDVTPDDFGRIAAQTAKQVILQRIREAERDMMFEEYQRPRRRADHRHRPAEGLPLHADPAARARRGAAAQGRAGRGRALRAQPAHQGGHQGGLDLHEGPARSSSRGATPS